MAEIPTVFQTRIPSGPIAADSAAILGQPVHTHDDLTKAITVADFNLIDSVSISEGAREAQQIANTNAGYTGSPSGPFGVQGIYPVVNGIAYLHPKP